MAVAEVRQPALRGETEAMTFGQRLARLPLHLILAAVALLWILPAAGLFVTSIIPAEISNAEGWWYVFSHPSVTTLDNYREMFDNDTLIHALWVTALVTIGATILPILVASLRRTRSRGSTSPAATTCSCSWSRSWSCRCRWR